MDLPNEIISIILHKLDLDSCRNVILCCHRLYNLVVQDKLNLRADINELRFVGRFQNGEFWVIERCGSTKDGRSFQINLNGTFNPNTIIGEKMSQLRAIKKISVSIMTIDMEFINVIYNSGHKIRNITFDDCDIQLLEDEFAEFLGFPSLNELTLRECKTLFVINDSTFNNANSLISLNIYSPKTPIILTDTFLKDCCLKRTDFRFSFYFETQFTLKGVLSYSKKRPTDFNVIGLISCSKAELENFRTQLEDIATVIGSKLVESTKKEGGVSIVSIGVRNYSLRLVVKPDSIS